MSEKADLDQVEAQGHYNDNNQEKRDHGDRALAIIGDERVIVTEEDVCLS